MVEAGLPIGYLDLRANLFDLPSVKYLIAGAGTLATNSGPLFRRELGQVFLHELPVFTIRGKDLHSSIVLSFAFTRHCAAIAPPAVDVGSNGVGIPKGSIFCQIANVAYLASQRSSPNLVDPSFIARSPIHPFAAKSAPCRTARKRASQAVLDQSTLVRPSSARLETKGKTRGL